MYQGYKELVEVLVLDWLRKTALPPWMKHEGNNETLVCPTLCRSTADCWWILNTADKTIFNWMRKWLSKTLQHIYISNKHYEIISLPFIRWGEVRSKQYDANRLLAAVSHFIPSVNSAVMAMLLCKVNLPASFTYCQPVLMPTNYKKQAKWAFFPNVQSDQIKKFSLNRDVDTDGSVSESVQRPVNQVGLKRQLLRDLISVIYLCNVYFSSVANMQM